MSIVGFFRKLNIRKILLRIVLIDLAVSLAGYALYRGASGEEETVFLSAAAEVTDIEYAVSAQGVLQGRNQVAVGAQVSGQLQSLKVKPGDKVKRNQLLAEIDPLPAKNALRQAVVKVEQLNAERDATLHKLKLAESNDRRYQELGSTEAVSKADQDKARFELETQRANLVSLTAQLHTAHVKEEAARIKLDYTRIFAPMDGQVLAIVTQEGQTVIADQMAPVILKMAQLDTMIVKAQISEADVLKIQSGLPVYFTIPGDPDRHHDATLKAIEPGPVDAASPSGTTGENSKAVFYNALFDVPNLENRFYINMTANVRIVLEAKKGVLTIPVAALGDRREDGTYSVRVLGEGTEVRTAYVEPGINNKVRVEIRSGLQAGDRVVIGERGGVEGV
ncbi:MULTISPECIES: efflux RND transporter periplasmic adaptor subunit [Pseudomonas]|uniref:Efflux RND transporter periplasmic adaptor subunit n=1 Tax=Pseudomonas syringae Cit 7 TaxID=629264 RepID=A0A8T8LQ29_PSESX|nr:efflux RND transporter periplasmic adaptor subunit [Pseudomonas syringae]MBC8881516.1 efflux RND transporter periplasmic adaptor subunit [Pseudomonas cerasi]ALE00030.1 hemolysin secretion protein D [Pseudomonas syringae UMAF0158]KPB27839.1 Secretion protein HlyD [Pseudomonas syringae pv. syringae]MBC9741550.1 efflux RND transporter periplasmic adaptor subunit [Pseudomonas syringae pv. syringae]MBC9748296.1 efflux RND transporter periplasmic adaptor subunit [Pseudomonas syringae pv. syringae